VQRRLPNKSRLRLEPYIFDAIARERSYRLGVKPSLSTAPACEYARDCTVGTIFGVKWVAAARNSRTCRCGHASPLSARAPCADAVIGLFCMAWYNAQSGKRAP
jgi:hypothetical protein